MLRNNTYTEQFLFLLKMYRFKILYLYILNEMLQMLKNIDDHTIHIHAYVTFPFSVSVVTLHRSIVHK